ncbi:MAG: IclR family transcriptional regulator [Bryobacteraceae bacterium]
MAAQKVTPKQGKDEEKGQYLVPVVLSTFHVLSELSRTGPLHLAELSQRTKVAKSTVFRILNTLHHLGYVWRDAESRTYSVSPRLAELSHDVDWSATLQRIAMPHMAMLRAEFNETVNLGRADFDRIIYLEVVESEHSLRLCERKGGWEYAHASALGKALLAFSPPSSLTSLFESAKFPALTNRTITQPGELMEELQRVRQRGYALDREESRLSAFCVGAPILDSEGFAVAGLSISGPSSRFNPIKDKRVVTVLLEAAREISRSFSEVQRHPVPMLTQIPRPVRKTRSVVTV